MTKIASMILAGILLAVAADGTQTFTGVITDSMCVHSPMLDEERGWMSLN